MEKILEAIFLGKGIERFKILTTIWLLILSIWITNYFINQLGFYFNVNFNNDEMIKEGINFLLSPIGVVSLIGFSFTCLIVFIWFRLFIALLSYFVIPLIEVFGSIIAIVLCLITLKFKRILEIKNLKISLLWVANIAGVYYEKEGKKFKGNNLMFSLYKEMAQNLNDTNIDILDNVYIICSILVSMIIVYYQYGLSEFVPNIIFKIVLGITVYWVFNSAFIFLLKRKKDKILNLLLEINQYEST